ncbi:MAG: branched-chain amino acid ABC transporter permease [Hyphomicrobiales bacterium]|nr:branched-chain amino acid ABC transporter permease [Hyphomicrobiales bacterium]MDE2113549.1 branched-chain amino acid ABC transporter permease [Hyphomicrobiales bacterium]
MLGQQLLNGVVLGAVYALFALGFTLIFGVLGVINLTYGFYFSAGAFLALYFTQGLGISMMLALLLAGIVTGGIAVILDGLLLTPLRRAKAPELASLMVTLGATLFLYSLMSAYFGTDIRRLPPKVFTNVGFNWLGLHIETSQLLILVTMVVIVSGLGWLTQRTRMGLAIRALAENGTAAQLAGINAGAVTRIVSFLSGGIGGLAGVLIGMNYNAIEPYMGEQMMLKGFAVVIMGGLGNIRGALVAGLMLGVLETLTAGYIGSSLKDAVGFGLAVLTLWVRPVGLFGRATIKRA